MGTRRLSILVALTGLLLSTYAAAQTRYNYFQPGGALSCTGQCTQQSVNLASGSFITGPLPYADLAAANAYSFLGNTTGASTSPASFGPLAAANLISAVMAADVIATANVTLSGLQTLDGQAGYAGEVVLAQAQSSSLEKGLYVMASGAWSRAVNFPAGYVIPQFCNLTVLIEKGTANQGLVWKMNTQSTATTIGTTGQTWTPANIPRATTTILGLSTVTSNNLPVSAVAVSPNNAGGAAFDCASFQDGTGSVGDGNSVSNTGACLLTDTHGHPAPALSEILTPSVSGTGCSLAAGTNTDSSGAITAAAAATCTLTFGSTFTTAAPRCSLANVGATVGATLTALPNTVAAIFATLAAGTFSYTCI